MAAQRLCAALGDKGAMPRIVELPAGPDGAKQGLDDYLVAHGADALRKLLMAAPGDGDGASVCAGDAGAGAAVKQGKGRAPSQATVLLQLALSSGAVLWHDADQRGFATLPVAEHREHQRIASTAFRSWLRKLFHDETDKAPNAAAIADALAVLEAKAVFDGPEHSVYLRTAEHDGHIYLDLVDADWKAVEVDAAGWRIVADPPVRFRRAKAMLQLPAPTEGGSVNDLRPFLNVSKRDFRLIVAWLLAAMRPTGPFPVLVLHGEQGSGKSTVARLLRSLIDPNTAPVRAEPRNAHDLAIAGNNAWAIALDNLSWLPPWLSDALCRLSTGGGFSTRTLYLDDEETIFDGQRPIVLNGIEEAATRPDLLDRSLLVGLPTIPEADRQTEAEFWAAFDEARPGILGALLSAVAVGIANLPNIKLDNLPRMADFSLWVSACEPALPWKQDAFMRAYLANRKMRAQ